MQSPPPLLAAAAAAPVSSYFLQSAAAAVTARTTTPTTTVLLPKAPQPTTVAPAVLPSLLTRRAALLATASSLFVVSSTSLSSARAEQAVALGDESLQDEERVVRVFQENTSSVVSIKVLKLSEGGPSSSSSSRTSSTSGTVDDGNAKVEGTGSGFIWDSKGHIVTNYHVVENFAVDRSGLQVCKVFLLDSNGNAFDKDAKLIGSDPSYDIAVLKVDVEEDKLRPAVIGTSLDLRVGQSCFAIGNPFGYQHTLTTGVVSGLGREIPSPNGQSIRGAIQTDAAINAGNSGGPLIDSHGHVVGVNTATFTRKGSGLSSGVNFAIPIDTVVRTVPNLIVYGTSTSNRF